MARDYVQEQETYFNMMADVDHTKHIGGLSATEELARLARLQAGQRVLDAGCGVGITTIYLAQQYSVRLTGVDIMPRMIGRARQRSYRSGLAGLVDFRVADVSHLPFAAGSYDAVLSESVLSFTPDPRRALSDLIRVTRPGGYVAFTEAIFVNPPPPDLVELLTKTSGLPHDLLDHNGWRELLADSGLRDIFAMDHTIDAAQEARSQYDRLGWQGYARTLGNSYKAFTKPEYRSMLRGALARPPADAFDYLGYGVYAGRVPG